LAVFKFKDYLDSDGFDTSIKSVKEISKIYFGNYYAYAKDLKIAATTFNKRIKSVRKFFNYLIDIKGY